MPARQEHTLLNSMVNTRFSFIRASHYLFESSYTRCVGWPISSRHFASLRIGIVRNCSGATETSFSLHFSVPLCLIAFRLLLRELFYKTNAIFPAKLGKSPHSRESCQAARYSKNHHASKPHFSAMKALNPLSRCSINDQLAQAPVALLSRASSSGRFIR